MRKPSVTRSPRGLSSVGLVLSVAIFLAGETSLRRLSGEPAPLAPPKDGGGIDPALKAAFDKEHRRIMDDFCEDLEKEAQWAIKRKLRGEARDVVKRIIRVHPEYESIEKLKKDVTTAPKPAAEDDLSKDRDALVRRLEKVADKQATRLYSLTLKCFKAGLFTDAYHLLSEIIEIAPDPKDSTHRKARSVLCYAWDRTEKQLVTEWEADRRRSHYLTGEGWVSKKDRKKWEEGLRLLNGEWVTIEAEKAARTRNAFNPYEVESEHFLVQTNLGRQQGFEYALILESFQQAFYRVFISYYDQVAGAKLLFQRAGPVKHKVYLFPSRIDYLNYIKERKGNDELLRRSAGFYSDGDRSSYLYWADDDEETYSTLFHEVAHQLFAESKQTTGGSTGNNWVPEGLGTYVETWLLRDGEWLPGKRTRSERLQTAREILRLQGDNFTVGQFVTIGHQEFHLPEVRGANYALSCALTHFFMHYSDGIYREDFMRFVSAYYAGRVHEESLGESIHIEGAAGPAAVLATLDGQFKDYMKKLPGASASKRSSSSRRAPSRSK